jgi:YggT family protein
LVYAITDKPLAFFRRFIPPLRIGVAAIDLSYIVIFTLISLARSAVHFF